MPPHFADALVQHNAGDHTMHHGDPNGQSATDTATAALHYSMSVGQTAEDTFLHEATAESQRHRDQNTAMTFVDAASHQPAPSPYEFSPLDQLKESSQQPEPPQHPLPPPPREQQQQRQSQSQQQQQEQQEQQEPPQQPQPRLHSHEPQQSTPAAAGLEQSPPVGGPPTPGKPVVGTDAWHKVRKDNHKEGKQAEYRYSRLPVPCILIPSCSRTPSSRNH